MKFDHEKIYFSCEYCTSIYFPEESRDGIRITGEEAPLSCPICKIPLTLAYAGKTQVSYCSKCRGLLIKQLDFLLVIETIRSKATQLLSTPPPLRREDLERKISCPQCHSQMDTHPYGGPGNIVIDNCPRCQLNWLDHNELHRITHSPDRVETGRYRPADYEKLLGSKKKDNR